MASLVVIEHKVRKALGGMVGRNGADRPLGAKQMSALIGHPEDSVLVLKILDNLFPDDAEGARRLTERMHPVLPDLLGDAVINIIEIVVLYRHGDTWEENRFERHLTVEVNKVRYPLEVGCTAAEATIFALTMLGIQDEQRARFAAKHHCLGSGMVTVSAQA